jgi:hypothetical protein
MRAATARGPEARDRAGRKAAPRAAGARQSTSHKSAPRAAERSKPRYDKKRATSKPTAPKKKAFKRK